MTSLALKYLPLGDYALRFLHWWGSELISILPNSWRAKLFRAPSETEAHFDGAKLNFAEGEDGRSNWDEDRLVVILPPSLFIFKDVAVPAMDGRALTKAADLFAETAFPLKKEVLAICAHKLERGSEGGPDSQSVRIYCAKNGDIELIEGLCFDQQLPLAAIRPEGIADGGFRGFLPRPLIRLRRSTRRAMVGALVTIAGLVLALGIYSWRIGERIVGLDEGLATVRGDVQELQIAARQADEAITIWTELSEEFAGVPLMQILEDLSSVAPPSDHLTDFRLAGETVRVSGLSASPTDLVTGIEGLGYTRGTRLLSTNAAASQDGGQAIQITFEIDGGVADE